MTDKETPQASASPRLPNASAQKGGIGYVLLWLLGVPIPVLILIGLLRGCA